MNVYKKLGEARVRIHSMPLKKSGQNKFSGYSYFELGDFMPHALKVFNEIGLFGAVSFSSDLATLTITSVDDGSSVQITSPMGSASLKGCHEVQNIGAVETYQRRYLWTTALELIENDILDATHDANQNVKKPAPPPAPAGKSLNAEDVIWAIQSCSDVNELQSLIPSCSAFLAGTPEYVKVKQAYSEKLNSLKVN